MTPACQGTTEDIVVRNLAPFIHTASHYGTEHAHIVEAVALG